MERLFLLVYKNLIYWAIGVSLAISFYSLQGQELKERGVYFPHTYQLKSSSFTVPCKIFGVRNDLVVSNDLLVEMEPTSIPMFNVFDASSITYLGSFGTKGKGPEEFIELEPRNAVCTESGLLVFDLIKGFISIDLSNFRQNKHFNIIENIRLPGLMFPLNDAIRLNDSIFIGLMYAQGATFVFDPYARYNSKSKKVDFFGTYPNIYPESKKHIYWQIYFRLTAVKPDHTRFTSFMTQVKMFQIFTSNGFMIKQVFMNIQKDFFDGDWIRSDAVQYYQDVKATDNYIFALCHGTNISKLDENIPVIEVWNWNGDPVCMLKLDKPINAFAISTKNMKIYGTTSTDIDKIFVYQIPLKSVLSIDIKY